MRLDDRLVEAYFIHRPNEAADREFGRSLREAAKKGVEVYAYRCRVSRKAVEIDSPIPVIL